MSGAELRVVCDHDGRRGKRTTVATMRRTADGWRDWGGPARRADGLLVMHDSSSTVALAGDRVARDDVNTAGHEEPDRYVHVLRCSRCALTATLRGEKLDVYLDALVANGLAAQGISLRVLTRA